MSMFTTLFGIASFTMILAWCFFLVFGQVTVKKLRKNPETKDALGVEYMSGLDTLNVAEALSTPRALNKKLEASPLSMLHADSELLYRHTTLLDRILARILFVLFYGSATALLSLAAAEAMGLFS
ncbi:hypothetical protein [Endozoicomonas numazuensis]|uniref:Uncharacterized protein n=1 Tax=Endozoicomonas numazuensis TaxID=1137799 RepID=A0A081MZB4_9GAMM|nr:hypothetical protein [Endozoicomonas numazuensis]KEQ11537.1 hypothetical protein GZ78_28755 [Endozoicomonas numazuensis]